MLNVTLTDDDLMERSYSEPKPERVKAGKGTKAAMAVIQRERDRKAGKSTPDSRGGIRSFIRGLINGAK